jgi:hypothetical protein
VAGLKPRRGLLREPVPPSWEPKDWKISVERWHHQADQLRAWATRPISVGKKSAKTEPVPLRRRCLLLAASAALEAAADALSLLLWVEPPDRASEPGWTARRVLEGSELARVRPKGE